MSDAIKKSIQVEVVYGLAEEQALLSVSVPDGSEIRDVILASNIIEQFPDIDLDKVKVGLFGKLTKMNQIVRERDRIEIYRPLIADPKEVRKRRAAEGKRLKKGGADASPEKFDK
jgi:putative ubiquitin-RnfH superfamily antitoxin RatB of RatAB toxin-antitoxin module